MAEKPLFEHPKWSGLNFLRKHVFDKFLALFSSSNSPVSRLFSDFWMTTRSKTDSKQAENTGLSIPRGLASVWKNPFLACFERLHRVLLGWGKIGLRAWGGGGRSSPFPGPPPSGLP